MPFDGTTYNHPASIIDRMLEILGPNGEHWTKEEFYIEEESSYCLMGALAKANGFPDEEWGLGKVDESAFMPQPIVAALTDALNDTTGEVTRVPEFNDLGTTTFADIRAVLTKARRILVSKYGKVVA